MYSLGKMCIRDSHLHEHQRGNQTVAGVSVLAEDDMTGLLAAQHKIVLLHIFVDIPIAYGGFFIADRCV